MPFFEHFGRKKRVRRRFGSKAAPKAWWEAADEFPPEALYGPAMDFEPAGDFEPIGTFDPLGSYTGVPEDGGEPEQDADDL